MKRRIFLFLTIFVVLVVIRTPAVLLDGLVARLSCNAFHLENAEGSIWRGRGFLVASDAALHKDQLWLHLQWQFLPVDLLDGALGWSFADSDKVLGEVSYGLRGLHLKQINLSLPAEILSLPLENPVFNRGWRGDIAIEAQEWRWRSGEGSFGQLDVVWRDAGTAYMPGRRLGDYSMKLVGEGDSIHLIVMTRDGDVQISGSGSLTRSGAFEYDGLIEGDPDVLRGLLAISAGMVRPGNAEGGYVVRIPAIN